jgi:predicted CoA-binding protein
MRLPSCWTAATTGLTATAAAAAAAAAAIASSTSSSAFIRRTTTITHKRVLTTMASGDASAFFQLQAFAVVGASEDRAKFGNKVLRCYVQHGYSVTPVNKRSTSIEGLTCVPSLAQWVGSQPPTALGVSLVTPPGVTKTVIEEGYALGLRHFFLQPGTHDKETDAWLRTLPDVAVVKGCVLVELGC